MLHKMNLQPTPFSQIKSGKKTIELRLYDEKRQKINVGDKIEFTCRADEKQRLMCEVTALYSFPSFEELYKNLPLEGCGYTEPDKASPDDMLLYYSAEEQKKHGVVGIEFKIL